MCPGPKWILTGTNNNIVQKYVIEGVPHKELHITPKFCKYLSTFEILMPFFLFLVFFPMSQSCTIFNEHVHLAKFGF